MNKLSQSLNRRRVALAILGSTVVLLGLVGAYTAKRLFARPGEAALRYVPSDALLVASFDLVPSPSQVLAFKHIDDSLSRNDLAKFAEGSILEAIDDSKAERAIKPLLLRSGAACLLPVEGKPNDMSGLIFFALSDGPQAQELLAKNAYPRFFKGFRYFMTGAKNKMALAVVDDLLVLTDKPEEFLKLRAIQDGSAPSIVSNPAFVEARKEVADDANVVTFCSSKLMAQMGGRKDDKFPAPDWVSFGLAIRDGGIGFSVASRMDMARSTEFKSICHIPAIRSDLYDVLPAGPYGMLVVSDLSGYFDFATTAITRTTGSDKSIRDMEDGVQKQMGLSVKKDLIPAFQGNAVIAAYPSQGTSAAGADLLIVVNDTNGATPADAADRLEAFIEQQTTKEGNAPKMFDEREIAGGHEYSLNSKEQGEMRKSLGQGMENSGIRKDVMIGNKEIAFATLGNVLVGATSKELLDKAVACYESKTGGLVGDSNFEPSEKTLLDGSQMAAAFSVSRMAEGVRNTIDTSKMDSNGRKLFDGILDAFSTLKEPFSIQSKTSPDGLTSGGLFIPMDYDKIIDLIGQNMKKH